MNNREEGISGETQAAEYLKNKGYKIVGRNFSCRQGEIDIIAKDKDYLVFVEVKARENTKFGMPFEAITDGKKRRLTAAANYYMMTHKCLGCDARFDVVSILRGEITHIENAF
ncbi:MAG: YraN family protein [Clostridia bacterium]